MSQEESPEDRQKLEFEALQACLFILCYILFAALEEYEKLISFLIVKINYRPYMEAILKTFEVDLH